MKVWITSEQFLSERKGIKQIICHTQGPLWDHDLPAFLMYEQDGDSHSQLRELEIALAKLEVTLAVLQREDYGIRSEYLDNLDFASDRIRKHMAWLAK